MQNRRSPSLQYVLGFILCIATACEDSTDSSGAKKIAFVTQPQSTASGALLGSEVTVALLDSHGGTVTSASNAVTVTVLDAGGAELRGVTTVAAVEGVATFTDLHIYKSGHYVLIASVEGLSDALSDPFNIVPGAPAKLEFTTTPSSALTNAIVNPAIDVAVEDRAGNLITTATNEVTLGIGANPGGATLVGTTTVVAAQGVARFTAVRISASGAGYTLIANAPSLDGAASRALNVTTGPPAQLAFLVQPSATLAGTPIAPTISVVVKDAIGNPVTTSASIPISISLGDGHELASLHGTTTATTVNGVATFSNLVIDSAFVGYSLRAISGGLAVATSARFDVLAGPPARLAFVNQPGTTNPGAVIDPALTVRVVDVLGNIVSTATTFVTMSLGSNPTSATLSGTLVVASTEGLARFSDLSIATNGTGYALRADAPGVAGATSAAFTIRPVLTFREVSEGYFHGCGLDLSAAAYCWGAVTGDATVQVSDLPVRAKTGLTFVRISSGRDHSCGLTAAGIAYCWGGNYAGQVGMGSTASTPEPTAVAGGLTFLSLSAGYSHTCGVATSGAAYCWGDNSFGELGTGDGAQHSAPTAVAGGLTFAVVNAGREMTCGVTLTNAAYCWGDNSSSALGNGTSLRSTVPSAVLGGLSFATVSSGGFHACGLTTAGKAYCWGSNGSRQLGDGTSTSRSTPIAVAGGLTFTSLSVGNRHNCGLTAAGVAYCWGDNSSGALAIGSLAGGSGVPTPVVGGLTFANISAGRFGTCGVAVNNTAYCWGSSALGFTYGAPVTAPLPIR